jgi:hypothetical protein
MTIAIELKKQRGELRDPGTMSRATFCTRYHHHKSSEPCPHTAVQATS